jgi:hypothetical protein
MPSSVIRSYQHDADKNILTITFVSGTVYQYLNVPESVYLKMKARISKGIFFNQHIKDKYEAVKVISADKGTERTSE